MRNNKPIPRSELKIGMRVKLPFSARFFYNYNKKYLWFKGTITKMGYKEGIPAIVEVSLRTGHGYNDMGRWLSLGSNIDKIYKQL